MVIAARSQHECMCAFAAIPALLYTHASMGLIDGRARCLTRHVPHDTRLYRRATRLAALKTERIFGRFEGSHGRADWSIQNMLYLHRMPVPASCPDGSHSAIHMSRYILLPVASIDPKSPSLQHASCKAGKRSSARTVDTVAPASPGSRSFCCTMGWAHRILVISQLALTPKGKNVG